MAQLKDKSHWLKENQRFEKKSGGSKERAKTVELLREMASLSNAGRKPGAAVKQLLGTRRGREIAELKSSDVEQLPNYPL